MFWKVWDTEHQSRGSIFTLEKERKQRMNDNDFIDLDVDIDI